QPLPARRARQSDFADRRARSRPVYFPGAGPSASWNARRSFGRGHGNYLSGELACHRCHLALIVDRNQMKHTVLIVEDEEDLREMMREALESRGYAVVT